MPDRFERQRLEVLRTLDILDRPAEAEFDAIVEATRRMFGWKIVLVSLVDADRQWFMARQGLCETQTNRDIAFCSHAVAANDLLIVRDTMLDPRFAANPLVLGPPFVRAYMGMPVRAAKRPGEPKLPLGTLCVIDDSPRDPTPDQIAMLRQMATLVETLFELRVATREAVTAALERQESLIGIDRMQRQLQQAERMANIGSWRLDLRGDAVEWSDQTYAIHGLTPADGEALATALDFYPPHDRALLEAALANCIATGEAYDLELEFVTARGEQRRVRAMGEAEHAPGGERIAIVGVIQDITDRYRLEQSLLETAQTDELTQVASRRGLNRHLDAAIEQARRDDTPLAVALLDLDRFKDVNDRFGHARGDEVLRVVAGRLRSATYLEDCFVARLGGDEFVLLLRGDDARANLVGLLRRLLFDLRYGIGHGEDRIMVSATIGVCGLDARHVTRSALLEAADQALYRAKRIKRGTAAIADRAKMVVAADAPASLRLAAGAR